MHSTYLDFDLEIGIGQGREYPVVVRSPAGEARTYMRLPFDELQLESRLKDLQIALLRSGGTRRRAPSKEEQTVQDFGRSLFDALVVGDVRSMYDVSLSRAEQAGQGLRLKLRIASPPLAALPWEFLYDGRRAEFLCLSMHTPIVRYLELPNPPRPLLLRPPLRILGMIASPSDVARLDVDRERERIEQALAGLLEQGLVELEWLAGQTWRDLQRAMRRGPWHIFHFVGHGAFDTNADEGLVLFCDEQGRAQRFRATELGRMLSDHRTLRLVILNACEGAKGSDRDIFSSTASILVQRGIPAVLAMQFEITDWAAVELSRTFYEAVADGLPVDAAVAEARRAVSWAVANTVEWGTPVLFMRSPDGVLFRASAPAEAPVEQIQRAPAPTKPVAQVEPAEPRGAQTGAAIQVFLGCAPDDEARVAQLYDRLAALGLKPWMEKRDILPGEKRQESKLRAVRASQFYLACLSSKSINQRGSLQRGLRAALDVWQEKLPGDVYLIPLRLEECAVPEELRDFQGVDLFDDSGWTTLLRGLKYGIVQANREVPAALLGELEGIPPGRDAKAGSALQMPAKPSSSSAPKVEIPPSVMTISEPFVMALVRVPAGEFLMGSDPTQDKGAYSDEQPQHSVHLEEFYIAGCPITNAQYSEFVKARQRKAPKHWSSKGTVPTGLEEHPVANVTWHDAVAFCQWLKEATGQPFRLPTEAEWEKAASWDERAHKKRIWPWGDTFDATRCNTSEDARHSRRVAHRLADLAPTSAVGSYPAGTSPYGILDMAGNVWEWTSSLHKGYPYDSGDGREDAKADGRRVLRGGSYLQDGRDARSAYRLHLNPDTCNEYYGFRVCLSPAQHS